MLAILLTMSLLMALMSLPACRKSDAKAQKKSSEDYERHKMETKDPDETSATRETTEPSQRDTSVRPSPTLSPTPTPNPNSQIITQLTAQDIQDMNGGNAIIVYGDEGYVSTIVGRFFDRPVDDEEDAINALRGLQTLLGIETGYFPFSVYGSTYRGYTIYTYQQLKGDMVVYNSSLKIVLDREGYPWMLQSSLATNLDYEVSDPKIDAAEAEKIVAEAWGGYCHIFSEYTMETCLVDFYHLSQHCFQVITNNPYQSDSFDMPYYINFVDYEGNFLRCYPTADLPDDRFADYGNETYFKDLEATDCTFTINRNGEDVTFTVPISYNTVDQKYYLADPVRKIIVGDYYEFTFNGGNLLFTCQEENKNWPEHDLFAYYNFIRVYDFFKEFNIESTDGFGMPILILMGYCESDKTPINNLANGGIMAGWSIMCVTRESDKCFSMDVCGHEFTHGISTFSRQGCVYHDEYGTVNEAFSEILGNISEMYVGDTTDTTWLLEETCGMPVICMSQPDLYAQPNTVGDQYYTPNSYASMTTDYTDLGGVHRNDSLITNLCCVLEQQGWTLEELANFFICAIEMHTTLADFDDMYAVFIAAAYVCDREEIIPLIDQYWQDKMLVGNRQKTNETTTIDGYAKMLITFGTEHLASHSLVFVYRVSDSEMIAWAPVQYDGVAVLRIPADEKAFIIVCEYEDDYFEKMTQYKYLNSQMSGWSLDSSLAGVVETKSGTLVTLPDYS